MSVSQYYQERNKLLADQKDEQAAILAHAAKTATDITAEDIEKMHKEDYDAWKADRVYANRITTSSDVLGEEALSLLWLRCNGYVGHDEIIGDFLDSIGNEKLLAALKKLSADDIAMVKACLLNGVTQEKYAADVGKSQSAVARKLSRIKAKLAAAVMK